VWCGGVSRRPRQTPRRRRRRAEKLDGTRPGLLKRIPRWIEVTAAAVVVAGAAVAVLSFLANRTEDLIGSGDAADVEVRQVVVVNGPVDTRLVDGVFQQTRDSTPQLDITVRNTGAKPVLLTKAQIEVVDSARLTVCEFQTGGEVALAGDYAIELPPVPAPEERVVVQPLHQEVPAGGVDRFKLWFRAPRSGEDQQVYALRVALTTDERGGTVSVGDFILGVPESVIAAGAGRVLPVAPSFEGDPSYRYRLQSTWCYRRNMAELQRVLGHDGQRSGAIAALADLQPAESWPAFTDDRPAAAAVEPLLRSPVGPGPLLAVFAAERAGTPELIAETRRRAAAAMLAEAEHALDLGYAFAVRGAIQDLHYVLDYAPSPKARELLGIAEANLLVAETLEPSTGGE
jgi:hypothetical protein